MTPTRVGQLSLYHTTVHWSYNLITLVHFILPHLKISLTVVVSIKESNMYCTGILVGKRNVLSCVTNGGSRNKFCGASTISNFLA